MFYQRLIYVHASRNPKPTRYRYAGNVNNLMFYHVDRGSNFRDWGWAYVESVIQCVYVSPDNLFYTNKIKLAVRLVPQHGLYM